MWPYPFGAFTNLLASASKVISSIPTRDKNFNELQMNVTDLEVYPCENYVCKMPLCHKTFLYYNKQRSKKCWEMRFFFNTSPNA